MSGVGGGPTTPEPVQRQITSLSRRAEPDAAAPSARLSRAVRERREQAHEQAHEQAQEQAQDAGAQDPAPEAPPPAAVPEAPPPAAEPGRRSTVAVNARVDAALRDRARTAFLATQLTESRTFSEFVERALLDRVLALEAEYNDGRPWHPTSRALKPGPP